MTEATARRVDSGNLDLRGDALRVLDHNELFGLQEYVEQHAAKREMEGAPSDEEVERTLAWSQGWEYRERNFAREALVINPLKACQPLGAVLAALGFAGTLPYVHGSQGCVAYFRSHLSRHFKEPVPAVSSSMTEDAAVFGGQANLIEGIENARALYKPDMIAISTTCMAEVIGERRQDVPGQRRGCRRPAGSASLRRTPTRRASSDPTSPATTRCSSRS